MTWMRTGTSTVLMALALMACASDLERPEGRATIAELIDKAAGRGSAGDAALDALAQLDEGSVPYLVGQLGDVRQLHGRRMTLTNKHHDAFEEFRTYSPDSIHDAVAAVLNQVTARALSLSTTAPHQRSAVKTGRNGLHGALTDIQSRRRCVRAMMKAASMGHSARAIAGDVVRVCRYLHVTAACLVIAACAQGPSDKDFSVYSKSPMACSSQGYIAELDEGAKIHYIFGAWHARPSSPCIDYIIAEQDPGVLLRLKREVERRGERTDPARMLEALVIKRDMGKLSDQDVIELELEGFCPRDDPSSRSCTAALAALRDPKP